MPDVGANVVAGRNGCSALFKVFGKSVSKGRNVESNEIGDRRAAVSGSFCRKLLVEVGEEQFGEAYDSAAHVVRRSRASIAAALPITR